MSWGKALRITRKSLKIQSWSCTIAIGWCGHFCKTFQVCGTTIATPRLKKITTMANCLDLKHELESEARWRIIFSFDLLVIFFLHDALQVNAMRLVKAQAKAVLNEIKRQGQQSWGLSSWAVQSFVWGKAHGGWLGVPFLKFLQITFVNSNLWSSQKKTTCFLDKRLHDLFDLQLLRLASGKHLHILDHGTIYAVDPCRRFCRRYGMIHANIFHSC